MASNDSKTFFSLPNYRHNASEPGTDPATLQQAILQPTLSFRPPPKRARKTVNPSAPKPVLYSFKIPDYPCKDENSTSSQPFFRTPTTPGPSTSLLPSLDLDIDQPFNPPSVPDSPLAESLTQLFEDNLQPSCSPFSCSPVTPRLDFETVSEPSSSPESILVTPSSSVFNWSTLESESLSSDPPLSRKSRAPRVSTLSKAQAALEALDKLGISVFELIATVLDPIHPCFASSRNAFFRRDTKLIPRLLQIHQQLRKVCDTIRLGH
ncbi:hypothetical protein BDP27DRAFT_1454625 [Rhodocollybia butyracea]|uniref:Uncharacterized protein n=1 Tax=Rhodocollybia butyracea TaxID=206335 RepID=A0A9P5P409_9AGAR|nr:hypothetical protein BDP27DRAFT_1454625 [Rhodocollybia butyracea]